MSDKSAADDFFGIEYMLSQSSKAEVKEEQEQVKDHSKSKKCFRIRTDVANMGKDISQLSGTEFLDRAFFPQLELDSETSEKDGDESSGDFFEEQFFKRRGSADSVNHASSRRDMVERNESKASATQMSKRDRSTDSSRPSLVKTSQIRKSAAPAEDHRKSVRSPRKGSDSFAESSDKPVEESGLAKIRDGIIPIWRMTQEELVELMVDRVLYKDDDIVAFDKPYGMAYSGASPTAPQLDRLLQKIKTIVVPKCERLYLVRSLDKFQSGIILFATNAAIQSDLKTNFEKGLVEQISRCIVRGELQDSPIKINIPLLKTVKDRDMKLVPLVSNKAKGEIFYVESECRTIRGNQYVSSVEVLTRREIPHQIRAHLALAGCPLVGDSKYSNSSPRPPRLSDHVLGSLNITDSQSRKIPMYLHLKEVNLSLASRPNAPVRITATVPAYFKWMLRKLKLVKR